MESVSVYSKLGECLDRGAQGTGTVRALGMHCAGHTDTKEKQHYVNEVKQCKRTVYENIVTFEIPVEDRGIVGV